jgi:hypothetical protein
MRTCVRARSQGNVAEAAIAAEAIKLGIDVIKPLTEHTRYDLIFDLRPRSFAFSANTRR